MSNRKTNGNDADEYYERKLASDITLHSLREGFFKDYLDDIDFQLTQEFIDSFSQFTTDQDRLSQIWNFKPIHILKPRSSYKQKNREKSELLRNEGNKAFQDRLNEEALKLYSKAVILAPCDEGESLSLGYANRSAVFFHQEEYQQCLNDIQLALEAGYPTRLRYKVLDRQGQCLVKLGQYEKASKAIAEAIEALPKAGLDTKKLNQWTKDLKEKALYCSGKTDNKENKDQLTPVPLYRDVNQSMPSASSAITINQSQTQGRYAVAKEAIPAGNILIAEKPYAIAMKPDKASILCYNCFQRLRAPVACKWCSGIAFCSIGCRDLALATHHKWECKYLDFLLESGMSLNCFLALRIITQHGLNFFQKIRPRIRDPVKLPSSESPHTPSDYLSVYNMVGLEELRPQNNLITLTVMASFLLKILKKAHYFEEKGTEGNNLSEDEAFIGGLLLRHLQVVQFNAFEVSGMEFRNEECRFEGSRSVFLGIGVYCTAALCNHSCYPSITRYFEGTKMILVNLRPLEPGDVIAENYGPIFTKNSLQERQKKLLASYWFNCTCEACLGDWPVYDNMTYSRDLRCQKCSATLPAKSPKQSHVTCRECGSSHDVFRALKELDEADKCYAEGKKYLEERNPEDAIHSFIKYINIVHRLVTLPMYELYVAYDGLRILFAEKSTIKLINKPM